MACYPHLFRLFADSLHSLKGVNEAAIGNFCYAKREGMRMIVLASKRFGILLAIAVATKLMQSMRSSLTNLLNIMITWIERRIV